MEKRGRKRQSGNEKRIFIATTIIITTIIIVIIVITIIVITIIVITIMVTVVTCQANEEWDTEVVDTPCEG